MREKQKGALSGEAVITPVGGNDGIAKGAPIAINIRTNPIFCKENIRRMGIRKLDEAIYKAKTLAHTVANPLFSLGLSRF